MPTDPVNPYSAPQTAIDKHVPKDAVIHRQEDLLVIPIGTELPDICLLTGRRSTGKFFDKKFTWSPGWVYIFLLVNLLVLLIIYLVVRKQGRLKYYLDGAVVTKMKKQALFSWLAFPLLILMIIAGTGLEIPLLIIVPILTIVVLLIVMLFIYPKLHIKKIDKTYIYVAKVHPDAMEYILSASDG